MTNKEFEKWMKANPIKFYNGVNGVTGTIVVNGFSLSVCGAPDQSKRVQKTYVKKRIAERVREILEN